MSDSDNRRINPIVPERDGMSGGGSAAKYSRSIPSNAVGGGWKFLIFVLLTAAAAGFGWLEFTSLQTNHRALQQRFDDLESRLSSTDESVTQSGAAMQVKLSRHQDELQKHWSEIKKLWGVSNDINKGKIAKNQTDIIFLAQKRVSVEQSMADLDADLVLEKKRIGAVSSNYLEMSGDVADLFVKFRALQDSRSQMSKATSNLERQLKSHAEAIESIDGFRRQTNQKLYKLEQRSASMSIDPSQIK